MTSNIGSPVILAAPTITDKIKQDIDKLLHAHFKPEFLNRIDAVVFFRRLNEEDVIKIAHIQLQEVQKRLTARHVDLKIDKKVYAKIAELGYEPEFGARPLKRAIQSFITVPISQFLLKNPDTKIVHVNVEKDSLAVS